MEVCRRGCGPENFRSFASFLNIFNLARTVHRREVARWSPSGDACMVTKPLDTAASTEIYAMRQAPSVSSECVVEPLHLGKHIPAAVEIEVVTGIPTGNHSRVRHFPSKCGQPPLLRGDRDRPPVGVGSLTDLDSRIRGDARVSSLYRTDRQRGGLHAREIDRVSVPPTTDLRPDGASCW
jgi:hypothetical protein